MLLGATVTAAAATPTKYNLMSLILEALGYTVSDNTKVPDVQVKIDGSLPFFPNQVRGLTLTPGAGGAMTLYDEKGNALLALPASTKEKIIDGDDEYVFLDKLYIDAAVAGTTCDVAAEAN